MTKAIVLAAGAAMVMAGSAHARVEEPLVLEPSSHWNLDMGTDRCRLARTFGEDGQKTLFVADQWDPSRYVELTVAGPPFDGFRDRRTTSHQFDQGGDVQEYQLLGIEFDEYGSGISRQTAFVKTLDAEGSATGDDGNERTAFAEIDAEGAEAVEWLTVSQRGERPVRLHLGSMKAPLTAMNACMADLVRHWGFDVEQQRSIVAGPKLTNLDKVVDRIVKVYPRGALNRGAQANFHLRLTVDAQGGIEKCVWLNQTQADDFDLEKGPCRIFEEYAQFEPARDAQEAGVRSYWTNKVVYRIAR